MFNSSQIKALLNVKIENGEDLVYEELGNRRDLLNAEIDERKAFFNEEIDERKAQIKEALEDRKELLDFEIDGKKKLLQEELDRRKEILSEELSHRKDLLTFDIIKGKTLFHHLVMHIDEDLVLQVFYLLDILDLIPLINTFDNEKKSPLHLAAIAKNARVFEEILYLFDNDEDRKRYIKQKDMYGRTPLHYVSKYSELTITPFTVYSEVAKREISFDPYQRFINIVQIIQDSLQDEFSDFVNVKDTDGKTSLLNCIKDMRYLVTILSCIDQDRIATCLDNTQANC